MAIEKKVTHEYTISDTDYILIRQITRIMEDGIEIGRSYHRKVIDPYTDDVSAENRKTQLLSDAVLNDDFKEPGGGKGKEDRK